MDELKADFADGGHVLISDNFRKNPLVPMLRRWPMSPDIIRWRWNTGASTSPKAISVRGLELLIAGTGEKFFGKKYKINEPNQWLAYAGWEP